MQSGGSPDGLENHCSEGSLSVALSLVEPIMMNLDFLNWTQCTSQNMNKLRPIILEAKFNELVKCHFKQTQAKTSFRVCIWISKANFLEKFTPAGKYLSN